VRILHAIQELRTGGAERLVVALTAGARVAGHDVATASAPGPLAGEIGAAAFPVPLVRRRPWLVPSAAWALRRAMRSWRPDLVHAHNPGIAVAVSLATWRGRARPALVSFHGVPDEDYGAAARLLRLAGLPVVACGPGVATGLEQHGLRVHTTIVNGISPPPPPADRQALERELKLPPGFPLVVSAGRLVPQKNHLLAIGALARVPGVALAVLGEGPLREELAGAAVELGVADRVVFPGLRPDARAVIAAADAVVIPSLWEGLPLVALESLAAGTPVVATAVRGLRELLVHEQTALLTPPGDEQALADALGRLLADSALGERLATAGRNASEEYTEEAMLARYLDFYEQLVHGPARPPGLHLRPSSG
jgi:glycosyltransferase involved in cell wall biosynthesis